MDVLPESTIVSERSQWDQRDSTLNSQQSGTRIRVIFGIQIQIPASKCRAGRFGRFTMAPWRLIRESWRLTLEKKIAYRLVWQI